ncbi:MAG: hypothetical protein K2L24_03125 [Opitutales bacterium]|nr:hypothetical protein [Opitutales bacterium]
MSLKIAEFGVGLVLLIIGLAFIFNTEGYGRGLRKFIRSSTAGTMTFSAAGIWFLGHVATLGESDFGRYKWVFFAFFTFIIVVTLLKLRDFLAVRGSAILALLTSNELLKAAFLQPQESRLVLVTFVYGMIVAGMIFGGWPYKAREALDFIYASAARARFVGVLIAGYGLLVLSTLFW